MAFVNVEPGSIGQAAQDIAGIGRTLDESVTSMSGPTTSMLPAAADEISTAIAGVFAKFGVDFRSLNVQAAQFHGKFVDLMGAGATAYPQAEAAAAATMNTVSADLNGIPTQIGGFVGERLLELGFEIGTAGNAITDGGQVLSANGRGLSAVANLGLSNLSAGLADPTLGQDLVRVVDAGRDGFLLQTGGSFLQSIGNGLEQLGFDTELTATGILQP